MMLLVDFLQQRFNLSDPAAEDALNDSVSMRRFIGLDLGQKRAPDETTICLSLHLLEQNQLGEVLIQYVLEYFKTNGIKVGKGTIIDASIIGAPPSTKNKDKHRDPDMHKGRKGNQRLFWIGREITCAGHIDADASPSKRDASVARDGLSS